jgi:glycine C-acetyltransferase
MADIFAKFEKRLGPIGDYAEKAPGYFAFPKLEGEIGNRMKFRGVEKNRLEPQQLPRPG